MPACHELRNPLHAVMATIRFLEEEKLTAEQIDDVKSLKGLATSMVRLVNDVLDLAKLNEGSLTLAFEQVRPGCTRGSCVSDVVLPMPPALPGEGCFVSALCPMSLPRH